MANQQVPPVNDFPLASFSNHASQLIGESAAEYQVSPELAAQLASLTVSYQEALDKAVHASTRSPLSTSDKNRAKKDLLDFLRPLLRMINNNVNVTDHQREALGLRIRKHPTPGHKPTNKPDLDVLEKTDTSIRFRAHNGDKLVRRLPAQCIGMMVWTHTGAVPPEDFEAWSCRGLFTRPTATVSFTGLGSGAKVWIACCWVNGHGQGPMSDPIEQRLNGLSFAQQAAQEGGEGGMSIAA